MPDPLDLLDLPAPRAARLHTLALLDALVEARVRHETHDDAESLHDVRVALRRLRTALRAFRPELEGAVRKRVRRALRRLARASGESRDLEVQLASLADQVATLAPRERAGAEALRVTLAERKEAADARLADLFARTFARTTHRLRRRLRRYTVTLDVEHPEEGDRFAGAIAAALDRTAARLERRLSGVRASTDEREAHAARVAGKRLRYVLEPVVDAVPEGRMLLERLKTLQDELGELHDAHLLTGEVARLAEESAVEQARRESLAAVAPAHGAGGRRARRRDPRPGLLALARRLSERGEAVFARLEHESLGPAGAETLALAHTAIRSLAARATRDLEIERKLLLDALPTEAETAPAAEIEQGWLPGDRLAERVRVVRDADGERFYRTVKLGTGIARRELEEETTRDVFDTLWPLTEGKRVRKRRHRVPDGDFVWEIDEFLDRELTLAEVELPSATADVAPPPWLAPHVVRDVTGDPEYVNINLAR